MCVCLSSKAKLIWSVLSTHTYIGFFGPNMNILVAVGPICQALSISQSLNLTLSLRDRDRAMK